LRVCPKCGHIDPPYWRQVPWKFDTDMCWTEDFKNLHPEVHAKLEKGHEIVCDDHFAYKFSGKPKTIVWRVWKQSYLDGGKSAFSIPMESVNHRKDPYQQKLSVSPKVAQEKK